MTTAYNAGITPRFVGNGRTFYGRSAPITMRDVRSVPYGRLFVWATGRSPDDAYLRAAQEGLGRNVDNFLDCDLESMSRGGQTVIALLNRILSRKQPATEFNPVPDVTETMPARPYRVLHAGIPFFSDPRCQNQVEDARLILLRCEDSAQKQQVHEPVPVRKTYKPGQLVTWELNNKKQWEESWYIDPDSGRIEHAWLQAVEFIGRVVA